MKGGGGAAGQRRDVPAPLIKMRNFGNNITKNEGDRMEYIVLLALNNKMFEQGIITEEEKIAIEMEILREK